VSARKASVARRSIYVLALVESAARLPDRIGRRRLEAIDVEGITCVVERRYTVPPVSERSLRDQFRTIVALHERVEAILPVRFGALIDIAELARIVRQRKTMLRRALRRVRGRTQMTVRVFGEPLVDERETSPRSGTAYLQARARAFRPDVPPTARAIRRAVQPFAADDSIERGRGRVRLVMHHLIARGAVARYQSRIDGVLAGAEDADTVVVSGPLPPYAFVPDVMDVTS
jgi:hypothetical protein